MSFLNNKTLYGTKTGQYIVLLLSSFLWGASFYLTKHGLYVFTPIEANAIRLSATCIGLLPFTVMRIKHLTKEIFMYIAIVAILGNSLPQILFTYAQQHIESAYAAMLNSLLPVFVFLWGLYIFKEKIRTIQLLGLLVGLLGTIGLIWQSGGSVELAINGYLLLIILAHIASGFSIMVIKHKLQILDAVSSACFIFTFLGIPSIIYLFTMNWNEYVQHTQFYNSLFSMIAIGIGGGIFALILFYTLIKYTSAVFASSVTYIIPIFAIMWGLGDNEKISFFHIIFTVIILTGVYLINKPKNSES
ncbi:MAG: DMT family transporter [Bacteroidales bacterium]